jgi:hypothetical protein
VHNIKNQLETISAKQGYKPKKLEILLSELKGPASLKSGEEWIEHIEHELSQSYWDQRQKQIFSFGKHKRLADELQNVLTQSLNIHHKYGVQIPKKVKGDAPNIKEIKKIQNGDFKITIENIDFNKRPFLEYAQAAKFIDENETFNLDTDKDRAKARIIIEEYLRHELYKRSGQNIGESKASSLSICKDLLSPAQMEVDEKKFPFTCALQRLKICLSPSHLTTFRDDIKINLMSDLADLAARDDLTEAAKAGVMKGLINQACGAIRKKIEENPETGLSRLWAPRQSRLEKALVNFSNTILAEVDAIAPQQTKTAHQVLSIKS